MRFLRALRRGFAAATETWPQRFAKFWLPRLGLLIAIMLMTLFLIPKEGVRGAYCAWGFTSYCPSQP